MTPPAVDRAGAESLVLNTFGSYESRDIRTRKKSFGKQIFLSGQLLPHIPLSVYKGQRSKLF